MNTASVLLASSEKDRFAGREVIIRQRRRYRVEVVRVDAVELIETILVGNGHGRSSAVQRQRTPGNGVPSAVAMRPLMLAGAAVGDELKHRLTSFRVAETAGSVDAKNALYFR